LRRFIETPVKRHKMPAFVNERDSLAWKTIAWLGLRRSEILGLKIQDVLLDEMLIIVRGIKNRRDRVMPLPPALKDDFQKLIADRGGKAYVFPGPWGEQWTESAFGNAFSAHLKACGLADRGITPHSLRHTFATFMVRADVNLVDVKELLGHVDIKSTMIYIHTGPERFRQALDKHILNAIQ
jgi:integrase/recombinase XerD